MSQVPMSITRLPDCSLLKVSGALDESTAEAFGRALLDTTNFSSLPVVIDLRDVDLIHPKAIKLLTGICRDARRKRTQLQIFVNFCCAELTEVLLEL